MAVITGASASAAPATRAIRVTADVAQHLPSGQAIDYGSYVWVPLTDSEFADAVAAGLAPDEPSADYVLRLGEQSFDPLFLPQPKVAARSADTAPHLRLVQFTGPAKAEWLDALRADGLEVVQYIEPYTYVVWGTAAQRDAARTRAHVRWSGDFAPDYRVLPHFRGRIGRAAASALVYRGADLHAVQRALVDRGATIGEIATVDDRFAHITFNIDAGRMADVATIPGVYTAKLTATDGGLRGELSDQINVNNVNAGNIPFTGYNAWLADVGLSGAGIIIANVDSGVDQSHPDLINRILPCVGSSCGGSTYSNHGTHTAGIMVADGSSGTLDDNGFLRGLGMAPGAHLVEQLYYPTWTQANGMRTLMRQSYDNGAILSGNSWGPAGSPQGYDQNTMQVDIGVRDVDADTPGNQPFIYVLSIMNGYGGTSSQGSPDEAKNILTIGSTRAQFSTGQPNPAINDVSPNSAHGPCLDGRKIPHLVAPGCNVDSTQPGGSYGVSNWCGTSMASPHVTGAIALFIEYYRSLPETSGDPSPALVKAAFTAVAHDLAGHLDADGGILGHPFDSKQGWGRLDAEAVLDPALDVRYFDNPVVFDNTGEEWSVTVNADDPLTPVRMMLVWTDAPGHGLGGSTPAWNNDLDLVVESGANTYLGNVFGTNGASTTGGVRESKNNTEGVFIESPGAGDITVRVLATSINSDALPGSGDTTDQDFSLVCYNCKRVAGFALSPAPAEVDVCAGDDASFAVDVASISGATDPVTLSVLNLPAGASALFNPNPVVPVGTSGLTITDTAGVTEGSYSIDIQGVSSNGVRSVAVMLNVFAGPPDAVTLAHPAAGSNGVVLVPTLAWAPAPTAQAYTVEVAGDPAFANIVFTATTTDTAATPTIALASHTTYFWRVRAANVCSNGADSAVQYFTTRVQPPVLLIDGDDNDPDVRAAYTAALDSNGIAYDVWDTNVGADEPTAADLAPYTMAIWFTGDLYGFFDPEVAGPSPTAEAALATFLDNGGCFFISSQDYHANRGLTDFMTAYLGVASVTNDTSQSTATGAGSLFTGFGPVTLDYPFSNFSDSLTPAPGAEASMVGNVGTMGLSHNGGAYHASFWAFPFEAIPTAGERAALMNELVTWCGAQPPLPGDFDGDGDLDDADFAHWADCMTGPAGGPTYNPCAAFDFDGDTDVDLVDFSMLATQWSGGI
ncbi:MAG TPA: S8 family serine peptidase [Phycisphaerae bacterium]|nr:S8 family serine peptidase [Phycisphaerae bacterium]